MCPHTTGHICRCVPTYLQMWKIFLSVERKIIYIYTRTNAHAHKHHKYVYMNQHAEQNVFFPLMAFYEPVKSQ